MHVQRSTNYVADDGTHFSTEIACREHELLCAKVSAVMAALVSRPDNFPSDRYLQHDPEVVLRAYGDMLRFILDGPWLKSAGGMRSWVQNSLAAPLDKHISWSARAVDECCPKPIWSAFWRFTATNLRSGREYQQPYFTEHEDEVKGGPLNPA